MAKIPPLGKKLIHLYDVSKEKPTNGNMITTVIFYVTAEIFHVPLWTGLMMSNGRGSLTTRLIRLHKLLRNSMKAWKRIAVLDPPKRLLNSQNPICQVELRLLINPGKFAEN